MLFDEYISNNQTEIGNGWGFFVELDVQQQFYRVPFKKPNKYLCFPIAQEMETIREETHIDIMRENRYNDYNDDNKKKEKAITSQIYSGVAICALAAYICFMV
jgi:hypothetical protein